MVILERFEMFLNLLHKLCWCILYEMSFSRDGLSLHRFVIVSLCIFSLVAAVGIESEKLCNKISTFSLFSRPHWNGLQILIKWQQRKCEDDHEWCSRKDLFYRVCDILNCP